MNALTTQLFSKNWKKVILAGLQIVGTTILLAFCLKQFVIDAVWVPSHSMESTLLPGDFILVNKLSYGVHGFSQAESPMFHLPGLKPVSRGDIVVFSFPGNGDRKISSSATYFVKRCVAVAGDTLLIRSGIVFVNGVQLGNRYGNAGMQYSSAEGHLFPSNAPYKLDDYGPVYIPKRGDVVQLSSQSIELYRSLIAREGHTLVTREDGAIMIDDTFAATYTIENNYSFVLGDNFYQSYDSRFWGFVSKKDILGEASMIYWSVNPSKLQPGFDSFLSSIRWDRIGTFIR